MNEMDNLIKNLILDIQMLKEKVQRLEENLHPKCKRCKQQVKEK